MPENALNKIQERAYEMEANTPRTTLTKKEMIGQSRYQLYCSMEYQTAFNNQSLEDIDNCRLLTVLPMVKKSYVNKI